MNKYSQQILSNLSGLIQDANEESIATEGFPLEINPSKAVPIEVHGKIVGFLSPETLTKRGKTYYRGMPYIDPKYRGMGVGFNFLSQYYSNKPMLVYIHSDNTASKNLYSKLGLSPTGKTLKAFNETYHQYVRE